MNPPPSEIDGAGEDRGAGRYHGFSLRSVTWGYREIFQQVIENLLAEGHLGGDRREVTETFFALLRRADETCFDHVLRQFLAAVSGRARWILAAPGVFHDLVDLGASLADRRLYYGTRLFETLASGGMGASPAELRLCIEWMRRLRNIDDELAMAFLAGFDRLVGRLRPDEFQRYVDVALEIRRRDPAGAAAFLRGELSTSETYLQAITQEVSLDREAEALTAWMHALTGESVEVADLGQLDSDELIARGTHTLTVEGRLYLPARFRQFPRRSMNRAWYRLCALSAAGMLLDNTFARVHGQRSYETCAELAGEDPTRIALFQTLEYTRVLRGACRRWPGCRRMIRRMGLAHLRELADRGDSQAHSPLRLLIDAMDEAADSRALRAVRRLADEAVNCFHTAGLLDRPELTAVRQAYPSLGRGPLEPIGFLSDVLFPVEIAAPTGEQRVADLKDAAGRAEAGRDDRPPAAPWSESGNRRGEGEAEPAALPAAYLYDEWDAELGQYRPDWCHVHPRRADDQPGARLREDWQREVRRVRAVFERIRPDLARRQKRLLDGDEINVDQLVEHLVARRIEPAPPARFYEKPLVRRRDLCTLILLDVSGSTGEQLEPACRRVLDVEKQATVTLAGGLATLGDEFAVTGFSSNGREQCEFLIFKGFDDRWDEPAVARVMGAWPRSSTRMGPALRHAGHLLGRRPHRRRLILLVTDGKPQDTGYDPSSRYAQHDVRMACEENRRRDIHTFAISTEANALADMELMFPGRRFAILPSIDRLPRVLPQLYLTLTT